MSETLKSDAAAPLTARPAGHDPFRDEPFRDDEFEAVREFALSLGDGINAIYGDDGNKLTTQGGIRVETVMKLDLLSKITRRGKAELLEQLVGAALKMEIERAKREAEDDERRAAFARLEGQPLMLVGGNFLGVEDSNFGTAVFQLQDGTTETHGIGCLRLIEVIMSIFHLHGDAHPGPWAGHLERVPAQECGDCLVDSFTSREDCGDCWTFVPDDADLRGKLETSLYEWRAQDAQRREWIRSEQAKRARATT
jgi:hypothetical protein